MLLIRTGRRSGEVDWWQILVSVTGIKHHKEPAQPNAGSVGEHDFLSICTQPWRWVRSGADGLSESYFGCKWRWYPFFARTDCSAAGHHIWVSCPHVALARCVSLVQSELFYHFHPLASGFWMNYTWRVIYNDVSVTELLLSLNSTFPPLSWRPRDALVA